MLTTVDLRGHTGTRRELAGLLPRPVIDVQAAIETVRPIIDDVARRGAPALREYTQRFDHCQPATLRVPASYLAQSLENLDPAVRRALGAAIDHVRAGHRLQLPAPASVEVVPGGWIHQRWIPVSRVGLYVPAGLAAYPSSVVMNVVPAQVAGVGSIAVASAPRADCDGMIHPTIAAACALLGIEEVYALGGAQAIAALAYGFSDEGTIAEPVDVITGPGNVYVAAAKRLIQSVCGIDAEAGPTEIAIISDSQADPAYLARDLISQAEHDPSAAAVLITDSEDIAEQTRRQVEEMVTGVRHLERVKTALSGPQSAIILTDGIDASVEVANAYGAEHLEIHARAPERVAEQITNAGAIFVGPYSPVPVGDYLAGSNHVLPTGGTARYASGLGVQAFLKSVQQIHYDATALASVTDDLVNLAQAEDLPAHGQAVLERRERKAAGSADLVAPAADALEAPTSAGGGQEG